MRIEEKEKGRNKGKKERKERKRKLKLEDMESYDIKALLAIWEEDARYGRCKKLYR